MSETTQTTKRMRRQRSPEEIAKTRRFHVQLLIALVLVVFASALAGGFVWSDREDILAGAYRMHSMDDLSAALSETRSAYRARILGNSTEGMSASWQPLTLIANTISWGLWGDCAFCFHLENVLLHILVVIGLYALGRHLLSHRRHGKRIAAWAAAVFAVHPATVSSVAWIGGLPYLLAALFSIWALVLFTRLQATSNSRHGHAKRWMILMVVATSAAMLAHETAYVLPLLVGLVAAFESKERGRKPLAGMSMLRWTGAGLVMATLLGILALRSLMLGSIEFGAAYPTESVANNLGSALRHLWYMIEEVLLPAEPVVSDAWRVTLSWGAGEVAALLGTLLLIGGTVIGFSLKQPAAFGVAWFLLWSIPGVGIFPSDHYHTSQSLYIAAWGLVFAVTHGLFLLWRPVGRQLVAGSEALIYVPLILVLGVMTGFSNARWWSHAGLFESEIAHDPHYMEGRLELAKAELEKGHPQKARNHALAAMEAAQDKNFTGFWSSRDAYFVLGRAQYELGAHAEAVANFETAIELQPAAAQSHYWLGVTRLALDDPLGAEMSLKEALQRRPGHTATQADLGVALVGQQRYVEAYPLLVEAMNAGIKTQRLHRALALTYIDANKLGEAAKQLEQTLEYGEDATDRARLAWVAWQLGNREKARADLNIALQMEDETSDYVDWVRSRIEKDVD